MYTAQARPGEDLWNMVVRNLLDEGELTAVGYNAWFTGLIPTDLTDSALTLYANDDYTRQTVENRYLKRITNVIKSKTGKDLEVHIKLSSERTSPGASVSSSKKNFTKQNATILPRYNFGTFVKGKNNELAFDACHAVAESPGETSYNPLFLYGGVGLGKTHLMHSIGNYILEFDPFINIIYTTSENLVNNFVASIRNREPEKFREKYRNVDVLMVDDVQFLIDKERSQEEFFHTFNALFHANKQIVLSSDKPPSQLKTLEERLSSRFGSGLVVDITKPDYETRLAILEKKAETEKFPIQGDMLQYLARNISSNIRDLEGAFIRVVAKAKLSKVPIDMALLTEAIKDVTSSSNLRPLDIPLIIEIVAEKYNVSPEELKSKKRTAALSSARHVAMYLTRKIMDKRLTAIGHEFGGRDHSTVVHAVDKITEAIELNKVFEQELHDLEKDICSVAR